MGQSDSQDCIQQQYDIVKAYEDGSALLRHRKNQEQFLLRSVCSNIGQEINGFQELLKKRQLIKSPHLLDLIQIRRKQQKNVCSVVHKMYLLIEYPFRTLRDQIIQKTARGKIVPFIEAQLWSILYSCCIGLNALYQKKIPHQSLTNKEIFISKEGLIKISDPLLLGLEKNYIRLLKKENQHIHVSPEIMNFLDDCNFSYYDKQKSDVFILGSIVLEASILRSVQLYQKQSKKPLLQNIPKALKQVRSRYSQTYAQTLQRMLNLHSKIRPKFLDIVNSIQQDNSLHDQTDQASFQQLNTTGQSFKNSKNKSYKTIPKGPINQPSLSKQSSAHQLGFNTVERAALKPYSNESQINRNRGQQQTIIKMLQTENIKNKSNHRQISLHQPQQPIYIPNPQMQINPNAVPTLNTNSNSSIYFKKPLNGITNNAMYCYQRNGHQQQQVHPQQIVVNQVQVPQNFVGEPDDRFSFTKFGKISLNNDSKPKQKPIFSYQIPEINQILKAQQNPTSYGFPTALPSPNPNPQPRPVSIQGQTQQQQHFAQNNQISFNANGTINYNDTLKVVPDFPTIAGSLESSVMTLNSTMKIIHQQPTSEPKLDAKMAIPGLNFKNQQPSYPKNDTVQEGQNQKFIPNMNPSNKISLNGILKQNSAKKNQIFAVTQKSQQNLQSSPVKLTSKNALKIPSPQKSPGVGMNIGIGMDGRSNDKQQSKNSSQKQRQRQWQKQQQNKQKQQSKYVVLALDGGGKYEGYMRNGMKNGEGKLEFNDGGFYAGQWRDNKMHGYGKLHYENGQVAYEGNWENDQFCGFGRVFNDRPEKLAQPFNYFDFADLSEKWIYYQGEFKNDSKHGKGKIRLTNGQVFQGNFVFDSIEGEGVFYSIKGQAIKGFWKDNMLIQK